MEIKHCIFIRCSFDFSLITILTLEEVGGVFIPHKAKKTKEYTWQRHTVFVWDEKQDISAGRQLSREVFFPCCTVSLGSTMC